MSLIMELKMSGPIFQDWMKDTSSMKKPPSAENMMSFVERYRRGLAATGTSIKTAYKPPLTVKKCFTWGNHRDVSSVMMRVTSFFIVQTSRTWDKRLLSGWRHACGNCLGEDHTSKNCPSRRSCRTCGRRHHSFLHRPNTPQQVNSPATTSPPASTSQSTNHVSTTDLVCNMTTCSMALGTCITTIEHRG